MKVYVGYISALYCWREVSREGEGLPVPLRSGRLSACCGSARESERILLPTWLVEPGKADLLVPSAEYRCQPQRYQYHIPRREYPERSFYEAGRDVCVACPELCFLQLAEELSVAGLVAVGLELCGRYRLLPEGGFSPHCKPLTTPGKIKRFLEKSEGLRGCRPAARALKWVLPDSASPMETMLYERVCFSKMLGGYAAPPPRFERAHEAHGWAADTGGT